MKHPSAQNLRLAGLRRRGGRISATLSRQQATPDLGENRATPRILIVKTVDAARLGDRAEAREARSPSTCSRSTPNFRIIQTGEDLFE